MARHHSPKLTIDGLRLCVDSANSKSYTNGSYEWIDISNYKHNGTISGGVSISNNALGSLQFDGSSGKIQLVSLSDLMDNGTNFTMQLWIYPTNLQYGVYTTVFDTIGRHLSLWIGLNGTGQFYSIGGYNAMYNTTDFNWENDKWQMVTVKKDGINGYIIKNANEITKLVTTGNTFANTLIIGEGVSGGTVVNYEGLIPIVNFYDRALSNGEIANNYETLKYRFGLP